MTTATTTAVKHYREKMTYSLIQFTGDNYGEINNALGARGPIIRPMRREERELWCAPKDTAAFRDIINGGMHPVPVGSWVGVYDNGGQTKWLSEEHFQQYFEEAK